MTDDGLPSVGRRDRLILRPRPARGYCSARDGNDGHPHALLKWRANMIALILGLVF
jgi:hypothetical protein